MKGRRSKKNGGDAADGEGGMEEGIWGEREVQRERGWEEGRGCLLPVRGEAGGADPEEGAAMAKEETRKKKKKKKKHSRERAFPTRKNE